MTTATLRRKATRTNRGRPAADDYPMPFSEPMRVQELAIEKWQDDPDQSWPRWDEVGDVTEMLAEVLDYEWGIKVATRTHKNANGPTYEEPDLYWSIYAPLEVTFTEDLNLDDLLAHGRVETLKDGDNCFHSEIAELTVLLAESALTGAAYGIEVEWTLRLMSDEHRDIYQRADWNAGTRLDTESEEFKAFDALQVQMEAALKNIYEAACRRCCDVLDKEYWYRNGEESIREILLNDDDTLFDEEGERA